MPAYSLDVPNQVLPICCPLNLLTHSVNQPMCSPPLPSNPCSFYDMVNAWDYVYAGQPAIWRLVGAAGAQTVLTSASFAYGGMSVTPIRVCDPNDATNCDDNGEKIGPSLVLSSTGRLYVPSTGQGVSDVANAATASAPIDTGEVHRPQAKRFWVLKASCTGTLSCTAHGAQLLRVLPQPQQHPCPAPLPHFHPPADWGDPSKGGLGDHTSGPFVGLTASGVYTAKDGVVYKLCS